jgi:hypothetical protein
MAICHRSFPEQADSGFIPTQQTLPLKQAGILVETPRDVEQNRTRDRIPPRRANLAFFIRNLQTTS